MIGIDSVNNIPFTYVRTTALAEIAEGMFMTRLLELEPQWQARLDGQREACQPLMQALRHAVSDFTRLSGFPEALGELDAGDPHHRDYRQLGAAFITQLGRAVTMTEQMRTRWAAVFGLLAEMQRAAAAA